MNYEDFIAKKALVSVPTGISKRVRLNSKLFPFQRDIVRWALKRGRAAIFADCGMGKAFMALEWARVVHETTGGNVLILTPLAVAQQTIREGAKFGIDSHYARTMLDAKPGITVTNYERLAGFDPSQFEGVVCDESSILKAYDGKTRSQIIDSFSKTPYRLSCTATPAPNDFIELGNQCEFLGALRRVEMLATFFVHDGGDTSLWRLKRHAEKDFWRWMASWAVMLRRPSDLGYDDGAFELPQLRIHERIVSTGKAPEGWLFHVAAKGLDEQRKARRKTMSDRVQTVAEIVNSTSGPWIVWCELNDEGNALESAIDGSIQVAGSDSNEVKEARMTGFTNGDFRVLISKPSIAGWGMNWQHCSQQAFVGMSNSYESYYQAIRRSWRFGQTNPVDVFAVTTDLEHDIWVNLQRKEADAMRLAEGIVSAMREETARNIRGATSDVEKYRAERAMTVPNWLRTEDEQ